MRCVFENGGAHSLDPWCRTHRRSAICCIQYANEALDAALLGNKWTTEPPTEPGWYWVRQGHNQPIVAWVRELDRKMRVKLFGNAYHNDVDEKMFTHWMKIEAPEPDAGRS